MTDDKSNKSNNMETRQGRKKAVKIPMKKNEGKDDVNHDYCLCKEYMGENFLWTAIAVILAPLLC